MLGLLGLMAALAAGIIADSLMHSGTAHDDPQSDADPDDSTDDPPQTGEMASLLQWPRDTPDLPGGDDEWDQAPDAISDPTSEDALPVAQGEYRTGDDQFDFAVQDDDQPLTRISDEDAGTDDIVVEYDAAQHPDPHLSLAPIAGSTDAMLLLDGMALATVQDGVRLDLSQIVLRAA